MEFYTLQTIADQQKSTEPALIKNDIMFINVREPES